MPKQKRSTLPLPEIVNPPDTICVQINVPNEPTYRQNFIGVVYELTRWYKHQRDELNTAKDVAAVWGEVFDEMLESMYEGCDVACTPEFRTLDCLLQWKPCPEDDWITIADLSSCAVPFLIRDLGDGQLQTSSGGGVWGDVPNAHYLHILSDNDPLLGGLAIHPLTDAQTVLVARHAVAVPTQSLFRFENVAGSPIFELNYDRMLDFYGNSNRIRFDRGGFDLIFNRTTTNFITVDDGTGSGTPTEILALRNRTTVALAIHALGKVTVGNAVARNAAFYATNNVAANPVGVFRAAVSQTGDLLQVRDQGDGVIGRVFPSGAMEFGANDTVNNAISTAIFAYHHSSATPVAGFGTAIRLLGDSTTVQKTPMGRIESEWVDPTNATRKAEMALVAYDTDARKFLRGGANGSGPTLGFLGAAPTPRRDLAGDAQGNQLLFDLVGLLAEKGILEVTGVTLGESPVPEPSVCELDRCGYAEVTILWFATQVFAVAVYWAGRYDELMFQSERFDKIIANTDVHFANQDTLGDWVNEIYIAYGIFDASDTDIEALIEEGETYLKNDVLPLLACYMSDCGYVTSEDWDAFIGELDDTAGVNHWVRDLFRCLDHFGLATLTSLAKHSVYAETISLDCETLDCDGDGWEVNMNFADVDWDASVSQYFGEWEYLSGFRGEAFDGGIYCELEIPFHFLAGTVVVHYSEFSASTGSVRVEEIGNSSNFEEFGQTAEVEHERTLTHDYPDGLKIMTYRGSASLSEPGNIIWIYRIEGVGTGPEPTP